MHHGRQNFSIRFSQHVLTETGNLLNVNLAGKQSFPSELFVWDDAKWLSSCAEEQDFAVIGPRMVHQSSIVDEHCQPFELVNHGMRSAGSSTRDSLHQHFHPGLKNIFHSSAAGQRMG